MHTVINCVGTFYIASAFIFYFRITKAGNSVQGEPSVKEDQLQQQLQEAEVERKKAERRSMDLESFQKLEEERHARYIRHI